MPSPVYLGEPDAGASRGLYPQCQFCEVTRQAGESRAGLSAMPHHATRASNGLDAQEHLLSGQDSQRLRHAGME